MVTNVSRNICDSRCLISEDGVKSLEEKKLAPKGKFPLEQKKAISIIQLGFCISKLAPDFELKDKISYDERI